MARVDLKVPFAQKDEAKTLGAKWDPDKKVWYVPEGADIKLFNKWVVESVPEDSIEVNLRASSYYIAVSARSCWKCQQKTKVYAFILPSGFEAFSCGEEPQDDCWVSYELPSPLTYITKLPRHAQEALSSITKNCYRDYSNTTHSSYWMNHCEHCKALLGDFDTIEDGAAFSPMSPGDAEKISLHHFNVPFEGNGSHFEYNSSMEFFKYMKKVE
jgi:Domain of unknown function (DUF5710)